MDGVRALRRTVRSRLVPASGARRHLAPGLSLEEFFAELQRRGVSYVVLRWFDDLPHVDPGEDVDVLVADEDLAVVHSLMTRRSGRRPTQAFDVYTVSGLPGSDFRGVPYYPPRFAREMLAGGVWLRDRYRVPDPEHHYDSLAYHAVYHKGPASGLAAGPGPGGERQPTDHDYEAVLTELGERLGRPLHPTLDSLDRHLADRGLRPPLDTLERLATGNPWIHEHLAVHAPPVEELWDGLAVFVLRDRAADQVDVATALLDEEGFELLDVVQLDAGQRATASDRLRGGNWARGPWPHSGGDPAVFLVAHDIAAGSAAGTAGSAGTSRVQLAKERLRVRLLEGVPGEARYNPVHSSDDARQALDYLEVLGGTYPRERLRARVQQLVDAGTFPHPVVRVLGGEARRARVAVVEHPVHGLTVCKLFRPGAARFLERELRARKDLADLPEIPDLLESDGNWVLTSLYDDDRGHVRRYLPGRQDAQLTGRAARQLARFAADLHRRGLFLLDLSSHNVVSDPVAGLTVLDLEYLQEHREPVADVRDSYSFRGVPAGVSGYDVPRRTSLTRTTGGSAFHPAVSGSPVEALLRPERPLDPVRRALVQRAWHLRFLARESRHRARAAVAGTRVGRDAAGLVRGVAGALAHPRRSR